ncbi:MAG: acylhydrolase [Muribaculaceae bacterium]|nr:acylhydrolase [Muribaculaceae bacterium]
MKKLFLTLAAVTAVSAIASAQAADWANHPRYAAANAELTQAPEVVFMGNSITDGWDDHHPEFFTDNNFACRGISGQVTGQMLCRFYSDVIDLKPKAVVILAGVNDIAGNQGPMDAQHIAENIFSMVELAQQHGIRPLIASCLPTDTIPWNPSVINTATHVVNLNTLLSDYAAKNGITYVDYYSALTTPEGALNPEFTFDRLHPNRAGYDVMEPIVLKALKHDTMYCKNAPDWKKAKKQKHHKKQKH